MSARRTAVRLRGTSPASLRRPAGCSAPVMHLEFDRGTLLLRDVPPGLDAASLPGVLWDPRVGAFRAPALRRADLLAALAAPPDAPASLGGWGCVDVRPYQAAALGAWEGAGRRGVVVLPTGAGKTRLAVAAMAAADAPTIVLVPTRVLLAQWLEELRRWRPGPIGVLGDGARDVRPVTVATFESAWRHMARLGDRFALLVVDEAHHFGRGLRDEALEMTTAGWRLGLTATPPAEAAPRARLEALLGPVVFALSVSDLAGRWLAPFEVVTLTLPLAPDERAEYEALRGAFLAVARPFFRARPGAAWVDLLRAARETDAGRRALVAWRRSRALLAYTRGKAAALRDLLARHRAARVLVFTADNAAAYAVAREHLVMPITCDVGRAERADALRRFAAGELRALVSARVLNEGLDVPDADVGVVVGATQGEREHVQRIGRLLRPGPGKRALVYELVTPDTPEMAQLAQRRAALAPRTTAPLRPAR
ncbi:MAG: DEAD/DEAH box helicase family protein [Planctomycetes bacterium]|nr:DEAD/DEAH box helicase family protein [Planctomycetota bacterium]